MSGDKKKDLQKALQETAEERQKEYYYKICPHCGAEAHIDNLYCVKCKKRMKEPGGIETVHKTGTDPGLSRSNLDHPEGCPSCGEGCRRCFSFGIKEPHPKARCRRCEKNMAACCLKARKLPLFFEMFPGMTVTEVMTGKAGNYRMLLEEFGKMLGEKILLCHSHTVIPEPPGFICPDRTKGGA